MKRRKLSRLISLLLAAALLMQDIQVTAAPAAVQEAEQKDTGTVTAETEEAKDTELEIIAEEESLRGEKEKHFRMSDGSYIAVSYNEPVHYQDASGEWKEIDNSLQLKRTGLGKKKYQSKNPVVPVTFSETLAEGEILTSTMEDVSVSMYLRDTTDAEDTPLGRITGRKEHQFNRDSGIRMEKEVRTSSAEEPGYLDDIAVENAETTVSYPEVYPGVDIVYTTYGYTLKEQIVVKEAQESYQYCFELKLEGLEAELNEDGSISLTDENDRERYYIPAPYMEDGTGVSSNEVFYTLEETETGYLLTVEADAAWMNAEERAYPVTIDPTLYIKETHTVSSSSSSIYSTYVIQGDPESTQNGYDPMFLGYGATSTVKGMRGYLYFKKLPSVPEGALVVGATLNMMLIDYSQVSCEKMPLSVFEVTDAKPSSYNNYYDWITNLSWDTRPSYDTDNEIDYSVESAAGVGEYSTWEITELVKKWYRESTANRTVAIAPSQEISYNKDHCAVMQYRAYGTNTGPCLIVAYRDNTGIEPYYTYQEVEAGNAGTGYISDESGQLKVVAPLAGYASTINPVSINLVYNSDYFAESQSASYQPMKKMGLDMTVGHGWTLDVVQKMEDKTLSGIEYKKYTDGDGTIHYFQKKEEDSVWFYDEDGLGLKVKETSANNYTMTDDHGNSWTFTGNYLTRITDFNGNRININYSNGRLVSVHQKNSDFTSIPVATFAYDDSTGRVTSVTDRAGNVYELEYSDTTGNFTSLYRNEEQLTWYRYDSRRLRRMIDMESEQAIGFSYEKGRIDLYWEVIGGDNNNTVGAYVSVTRPNYEKTIYRDYGQDRTEGTSDDILTSYLFDYAGRTINVYTTDNEGNILGASNAAYSGSGDTNKTNNRTLQTGTVGRQARNLLLNTSVESTSEETWTLTNMSVSTAKAHTGVRSLKGSAGSSENLAKKDTPKLQAGKSYTFSAYVNTSQITEFAGEGVCLEVEDSTGDTTWTSQPADYATSETIDGGWIRLHVTFTAVTSAVHSVRVKCSGGSGTFYVDDFQFEEGKEVSAYNMLQNGGLEQSDYGWTFGSSARLYTSHGVAGTSRSIRIDSRPLDDDNPRAHQDIKVNLPSTETYVLSGWVWAYAVPDNLNTASNKAEDKNKQCGLRIALYYTDDTKDVYYVPFNPDLEEWQFVSQTIVPKDSEEIKTVERIRIICAYEGNANRAYFDNIALVREAAQTMTYDDDGNLEYVTTNGLNSDKNEYSGGNLIKTVTSGYGTYEFHYDEDNKHQLNSVEGHYLTESMTYDDNGNILTAKLKDKDGGEAREIKSTSTYYSSGNLAESVTDTNGSTVSYAYGSSNNNVIYGIPNAITEANGTVLNQTIDDSGKITSTSVSNKVNVGYTYSKDNLSKITRTDTENQKTQEYGFTYDAFGNTTSAKVGEKTLATYTYGIQNGLPTGMTYGNEDTISYSYDTLGRDLLTVYDDGTAISYQYDGDGQIYSVKENDENQTTLNYYSYDSLGRLISSRQQTGNTTVLQTGQKYNADNKLTKQSWMLGNGDGAAVYEETYSYNKYDGLIRKIANSGTGDTQDINYDGLRRLISVGNGKYTKQYTYRDISDSQTTNQISSLVYTELTEPLTYTYTYDAAGNITAVQDPIDGAKSYVYDSLGQMTSETIGNSTYTYTYDNAGNIVAASTHSGSHTYEYGDSDWKDLLTKYDGQSITYDGIGNPLNYYNGQSFTFTWENGRYLKEAVSGDMEISYEYSMADGMRKSKTVGDKTYKYYYASGQLLRMEVSDGKVMDFFYDHAGQPYAVKYNGTVYYYILNQQGDVVRLITSTGETTGTYSYDAWGNILSETENEVTGLNPLRYRGYCYDAETGFYYVSSRYYDPEVGRFISADGQIAGVGGDINGYNLFSYCQNNPVNMSDPDGNWPKWATKVLVGAAVIAAAAIVTVATGGAAAGTLAAAVHCVAAGALKGAIIGGVVGATVGGASAAVKHRVKTGSWKGSGKATRDGAADGFMSGSIGGAISGGMTSNVCFVAGTSVLTAVGCTAIEDISPGDNVWSENPETGEKELKEVVQIFVNETDELVHVHVNGEEIITTPEHPFYVPKKGWVGAIDLRAGDILVLQSGEYVVVEMIQHEILESPMTVYNFEVEDFHTYYVSDSAVLVHNVCGTVPTRDLQSTHGLTNSRNQMKKLINDIKVNGIKEPIKYVDVKGTKYIVDGHHRLEAAKRLGMVNVPAVEVGLPYAGYNSVIDLFW